jgi:rRNA maturation endonuclease Nob1
MKRIVILALACALAPLASAQLYKSIDKDGKVVYSDTPPTNTESKQINVQPSGGPGGTAAKSYTARDKENDKARDDLKDKAKKAEENAKVAAANEERCKEARSEARMYADGGRLAKTNDKGERVYLGDAEIEAERVRSQKAAEEACKK